MIYRLAIIVLLLFSGWVAAGQINQAGIDHDDGVYNISFDVEIDRDIDTVRAIVTDYAHLTQLSDMFIESHEFNSPEDKSRQRLLVANVCLLFICRQVKMAERVEALNLNEFITTVIPEHSDFKSGTMHWRLTKLTDQKTRLVFYGREEPDFWIPPVVGPLIVKNILLRQALIIINNIEKISIDD